MNRIEIGTPAAHHINGDSYPCTVIASTKNGGKITVQYDEARVVSGSTFQGNEVYEFERNPNGRTEVFTRRTDGRYRPKGSKYASLSIGKWYASRDPHF